MHRALARAGWSSNAGGALAVTVQPRGRAPDRARKGTGVGVPDVTVTRMKARQEAGPVGMTRVYMCDIWLQRDKGPIPALQALSVPGVASPETQSNVFKGDPGWCSLPAALVGDGAVTISWRSAWAS